MASDLVQSIITAHGGLTLYKSLTSITTTFHFTGLTLHLKHRPQHLTPRATISTTTQKVTYRGLGGSPDEEWVYTPSHVWKARISDGSIIESRDDPREAFKGHTLDTEWDDLHFVYFCGYALWQYFNFPYLLAREDFSSREVETHEEAGQRWRVLEVTFPEQEVVASHCRVQRYYFNDNFALMRHDYAPDVIGGIPAAHYAYDEVEVGGMKFPGIRRVVAVQGKEEGGLPMLHGPFPTLIHLLFTSIELRGADDDVAPMTWALTEAPAAVL